ncbi:MAG TPA: DUF3788 domain-containing protein [Bacteroidales bacterium]|nr:DUF3788 domain-containing protein [Bacteroidales bacterium]
MALSCFTDPSVTPDNKALAAALSSSFSWWNEIKDFVFQQYPMTVEEWKHSGKNYGWGFRLKDSKRVIVYLTPADGFFLFSIVFGEKATQEVLNSDISEDIKKTLREAKVYAEGRGVRLEITSKKMISDVKKLVLIKLKN